VNTLYPFLLNTILWNDEMICSVSLWFVKLFESSEKIALNFANSSRYCLTVSLIQCFSESMIIQMTVNFNILPHWGTLSMKRQSELIHDDLFRLPITPKISYNSHEA